MSKQSIQIDIPSFAIKHIEKLRILFAVNDSTNEIEPFVQLSTYLELLNKIEKLTTQKSQYKIPDRTDL